MNKPAYFISDLHLGATTEGVIADREQRLVDLLRGWRGQASHVVFVGDSFEFWMEYRHYINRHHFPFLRALAELVESGVQVHLLSGNHDFRLDDFFPTALGVQVHSTLKLELQGKKIWFQHGDGVAKSDWGYRLASRVIHSPINVFLFRLLHPDWGMALANWVGRTSRKVNEDADPKIAEYQEAWRKLMVREDCNVVVHGHNHHPSIKLDIEGTVVNCGQWLFELNYVEFRDGNFEIKTP